MRIKKNYSAVIELDEQEVAEFCIVANNSIRDQINKDWEHAERNIIGRIYEELKK